MAWLPDRLKNRLVRRLVGPTNVKERDKALSNQYALSERYHINWYLLYKHKSAYCNFVTMLLKEWKVSLIVTVHKKVDLTKATNLKQ